MIKWTKQDYGKSIMLADQVYEARSDCEEVQV